MIKCRNFTKYVRGYDKNFSLRKLAEIDSSQSDISGKG